MSDEFFFLDEPMLEFGNGQLADDPHDGLALFGPPNPPARLPDHVAIGTEQGLRLWEGWVRELNSSASCVEIERQRPWPPYPGYDVAFGSRWASPVKQYTIDRELLSHSSFLAERYHRAFAVANHYIEPFESKIPKLDSKPGLAVCIVPDDVFKNCRMKSRVIESSDNGASLEPMKDYRRLLEDERSGQTAFQFDDEEPPSLEFMKLSPDFRRQIKARVMAYDIPIQIIKESTLTITDQIRNGEKGVNPLSDRLWNTGTALYYKSGHKPWRTPWAREGVCYIGMAYRIDDRDHRSACCAAQMFLNDGDGVVFVGEFGPWYSEDRKEFHLSKKAATQLLRGVLETYAGMDGPKLKEVFLHARSGLDSEEFAGFQDACPDDVDLVGIRVRKDRFGPRLFRHDDNPKAGDRGKHPVLRGTFWKRTNRHGLLFTSGFKPRIATYDGWEIPTPLEITVQHGEADIVQVARDILGLTKLNYNACQLGESQPITVKYSDKVGEILLANPDMPRDGWRPNFKFYI